METREGSFKVRTYECGVDGRIRLHTLMQYLQEAASGHAEELSFGHERMRRIGGYWALSNMRIEIEELPRWNDEVTIRTWPSGYGRVTATREFVGIGRSGGELFRAGSEWMILDKARGRPKNLTHLDPGLPGAEVKAIPGQLKRLQPQAGYNQGGRINVSYSSIDLNGHVNNTEYVRWGVDALHRTLKPEGKISGLHVTYLAEVFEGEGVDVLVCGGGIGRFDVLGRKPEEEINVFMMELCIRDD